MLRLRMTMSVAVFAGLLFMSALAGGQNVETLSSPKVDQPFSTIQSSLAAAADSALNAVPVEKPLSAPSVAAPGALEVTDAEMEHTSQIKNARLDALRAVIQPILAREGVPTNLAAVIQVESAGNPLALSPKGARGLWQLMPDTARRYGLRVDFETDERIDIRKSTGAAAHYLRDLYVQFGSWPLALAAYNTGEQHLQRAINRAGSGEFATLSMLRYIPDETRNYVPAVLAAMGAQSLMESQSASTLTPTQFVYAFSSR
jgi:soluble lytic murein transglycosylase-like protein